MKKLSDILNETPQGITESIVVPSYILSTLKTLGFTPAEPGPKTYRIISGPNKIDAARRLCRLRPALNRYFQ